MKCKHCGSEESPITASDSARRPDDKGTTCYDVCANCGRPYEDEQPMTEKIEPCPFCGAPLLFNNVLAKSEQVYFCDNLGCPMSPPYTISIRKVTVHNNLCRSIRLSKVAVHVREAFAAFARILHAHGLLDEAIDEAKAAGVADGFGKELDSLIREIEGTTE